MLRSETNVHVRTVCINQVLGTDMKKHFDITSRFQARLSAVTTVLRHNCVAPHMCMCGGDHACAHLLPEYITGHRHAEAM